jgi:putative ATPase
MASGDARRALTFLEASASGVEFGGEITLEVVERAIQHVAVRYDKDGDQHYDVVSAFIKSVRGSDPDAALHYLARMLEAGEDPRFIARRLMILASEDIGMADPSVLQTTVSAASAVAMIGMPEARIILAHATVHAALAPKSNAIIVGIDQAVADVRSGRVGVVPPALRDAHYPGARDLGHGSEYLYPHNEPGGVARQNYLPAELSGRRYYLPTDHGAEARWAAILEAIETKRSGAAATDNDAS